MNQDLGMSVRRPMLRSAGSGRTLIRLRLPRLLATGTGNRKDPETTDNPCRRSNPAPAATDDALERDVKRSSRLIRGSTLYPGQRISVPSADPYCRGINCTP
jgi:hypothetical protein